MRNVGGYQHVVNAIKKLEDNHEKHIVAYGKGNELRLTGNHETSSMDTFTSGVADRGASVRIPHDTVKNGSGYFEDRRPSSNMDPYVCFINFRDKFIQLKKSKHRLSIPINKCF